MTKKATGIIDGEEIKITIEEQEDSESPREWSNIGKMISFHSRYNLGDAHDYDEPREFLETLAEELANTQVFKDEIEEVAKEHFSYTIQANEEDGYIIATKMSDNLFEGETFDTKEEAKERLEEEKENWMDCDAIRHMTFDQLEKIIEQENVLLPLYLYDHSGITINTTGFSCPWDSGQVGYIYASKEDFRKETSYSETELFSKDSSREPNVKELVMLKNQPINRDALFEIDKYGRLISKEDGLITVDYDYNKIASYRKPENIVQAKLEEVEKVLTERAKQILEAEVEIFDQYIRGDIYAYSIAVKDETCDDGSYDEINSCGGFYGDNPFTNGMSENIDKKYHDILKELV